MSRGIRHFFRRFSVYGDLPARFQAWAAGKCPHFLEPIFLGGYSLLFFLILGKARRAIMQNLAVILPGSRPAENFFRSFQVIWNFSYTMTDAARTRNGQEIIDWEIEGQESFEEIVGSDRGAIILTAHMGNYDVAAPMFAGKFRGRRLNAVRAPERHAETQDWMRRELENQHSDTYVVRYNTADNLLGIDLVRALNRGEIVAIQGDRVEFGLSTVSVPLDGSGRHLSVPKGPFALALAARTAIHPLFVIRMGRRRYRILIQPPLKCRNDTRDRGAAISEAAETWVDSLIPVVRKYWQQWYVFEPVFANGENSGPQS